ncbi:hypothetical protein HYFRA_00006599 [Hymenoscyphus fraxineus]|uniref:Cytochrome P450 n=1 Tax=Hymenoscyphus fraxineus TaxID=746836 RepID=A0A9N9KT37_9HELO|nr:hypothetical protein HYFRA_00006599 [Hymenoscyphus fraxineus]
MDYLSAINGVIHVPPLHSVLKALFVAWAVYFFFDCVYSIYFHPLRHFPGPFWASISNFWKLYIAITKESHIRGIKYHEKYGPVIRVAPNLLVFNDPMLLPTVYHRYADKTDFYSPGVLGRVTPPFQTKDHKEHAMKRKRVAPSFQMTNLKKLEVEVDDSINQLTSIFEEKYAEKDIQIDLSDWLKWFIYDTVSGLAFGKSPGFVKNGMDVEGLIESFHSMAPMAGLVATLPHIMNSILNTPILGNWLMPHSGDGTGTGRIMQFRDNMLQDRLANRHENAHGDFLDNIMNAKNSDGSFMTEDEIKVEALVLMVAATDTTAAFIGSFVQNIISNSVVHERLQNEIQEFDVQERLNTGVVTYEEALTLPYFQACIKESLRFSPSTPFMMPRLVSKGGITINGIFVPEGTEIGANPYVVHRDTKVFGADAANFNPDRWLASEARTKEMDKYVLTWGYGPRICLGKNIAQMITNKLCLELFRKFNFGCVNPEQPWREENLAIMVYYDHWLSIKPKTRA